MVSFLRRPELQTPLAAPHLLDRDHSILAFNERVLSWARSNPGAQITTIQVASGSNLDQTNDMRNKNAWKQTLAADFERAPDGYRLVDRRAHPESGLTVSYYLPAGP